ncbi:MAG: sugar-binding transcriptional regulator [Candidatus Caldatribacteriaceae bacterium]
MEDPQMGLVSILYFEKELSQQEIASRFGVSKMTISRILQRAKDLGVVEIRIQKPFETNEVLEKAIREKFDIKRVHVVVPKETKEAITSFLGRFWAFQMNLTLSRGTILGVGVGRTVAEVVNHLLPMKLDNVEVVQLLGGLTDVTQENPFSIVQELCRKLKARGTYLASLATVENKLWRDQLLYQTPNGVALYKQWGRCQQAIFGIGALDGGTLLGSHLVTEEEMREIREKGGVGDVLGHAFDARGRFLSTRLEERLVSIPVDILCKIPERVAIGGGVFKARAIQGLLRTRVVTTLVTDEECARRVMES